MEQDKRSETWATGDREWGKATAYLDALEPIGAEEKARRVAALRAVAQMSREDSTARAFILRLLQCVEREHPEAAATFRAYYLEGRHQSAREMGDVLCMDTTTVHRHNRRILEAMLPAAFGLAGIFQPAKGRENEVTTYIAALEVWQGTKGD